MQIGKQFYKKLLKVETLHEEEEKEDKEESPCLLTKDMVILLLLLLPKKKPPFQCLAAIRFFFLSIFFSLSCAKKTSLTIPCSKTSGKVGGGKKNSETKKS
jgi:hypothetical protein